MPDVPTNRCVLAMGVLPRMPFRGIGGYGRRQGQRAMADIVLDAILVLGVAPAMGSFVAALAERLPAGRPMLLARSSCDACGRVLGPRELVPLLSYLVQRGRCAGCGARI